MKKNHLFPKFLIGALLCLFVFGKAIADTILMPNNRTLSGIIIQTNDDEVLVLTSHAVFNFSKASIKGVRAESPVDANSSSASRFSDFQKTVLSLTQQSWATNISPIAATVIDVGILRNVPYTSLRCGEDYEVNIYGDLAHPAGIEIGIYRKLLTDDSAKANCVKFISGLLNQSADKEFLAGLNRTKDLKSLDGLTFEITPPTDEDSYNGWWVSVYSEKQLNQARASDAEIGQISLTKADAAKDASENKDSASWSADELKQARPSSKTLISFTNTSGDFISHAEVVRVIDGVSLIWRKDAAGGMVRLADLPEDLRAQFGYDAAKTKAADELASARKAQWQQQVQASAQAAAQYQSQDVSPSYASDDYSSGGRVYVHGYYRKNGTYVHSYTRSYPHR